MDSEFGLMYNIMPLIMVKFFQMFKLYKGDPDTIDINYYVITLFSPW